MSNDLWTAGAQCDYILAMFIAHIPAGFLLTRGVQKATKTRRYLWLGLLSSVLPDFDLFYLYLVDDNRTLHHFYYTHLPLFWLALWVTTCGTATLFKRRALLLPATIVFLNVELHMVLDTVVGGINWLYPFLNRNVVLFEIPASKLYWVWSFLFHWTFMLEAVIMAAAAVVLTVEWRHGRK